MEAPNTKEKILFWGAVAGLSTIIATTGYYLYKYIVEEDEEDNNEQAKEITPKKDEISKDINLNDLYVEGKLSTEGLVKLVIKINKLTEYYYARDFPDMDNRRREAIGNNELYTQLCQETLMNREICTQKATNEILGKLGDSKINMEFLQAQLQTIHTTLQKNSTSSTTITAY